MLMHLLEASVTAQYARAGGPPGPDGSLRPPQSNCRQLSPGPRAPRRNPTTKSSYGTDRKTILCKVHIRKVRPATGLRSPRWPRVRQPSPSFESLALAEVPHWRASFLARAGRKSRCRKKLFRLRRLGAKATVLSLGSRPQTTRFLRERGCQTPQNHEGPQIVSNCRESPSLCHRSHGRPRWQAASNHEPSRPWTVQSRRLLRTVCSPVSKPRRQ